MGQYEDWQVNSSVEMERHRGKMAAIIERAFPEREYSKLLDLSDQTLRELYDAACKSLRGESYKKIYEEQYDEFAIPDEVDDAKREER